MSDNIVKFRPKNYIDNPDAIFEEAVGDYSAALVIGWDKDGDFSVRSSIVDGAELLWLVESFKTQLMNGDYSGGDE